LHTSFGEISERTLFIVALSDGDGRCGYGEAAPLEAYDGIPVREVESALLDYARMLERLGPTNAAQLIEACRRERPLPAALAAIDMALWDLAGRREGRPVAELLVDHPAESVPLNATVTAPDRAGVAEQAAQAVREGFGCVKLKVGMGDDPGRAAALRAAAGPKVALRLDANGAWGVAEAVRAIEALQPCGLELVEEPVHGLRAVAEVRERVAARISIDETAAEPGALASGAADAVCLKLSRCGGIATLLAAASLVQASGAEAYIASSLDGPLGIAAGVHAAAALSARTRLPHCGLATLSLFAGLADRLPVRDGAMLTPRLPGLGVAP